MLILFDHSTPRALRRFLRGHTVHVTEQLGWHRLSNGLLINRAEAWGYELFISADQTIQYQQNLSARNIAILVLMKNNWGLIRPRIDDIVTAVNRIRPRDYVEIDFPMPPLEPYDGGEGNR